MVLCYYSHLLDEGELGLEAGDELFFLFDLLLGFEDEVGGSAFDVVGVLHPEVEGVEFATDGEDFLSEGIFVVCDDLLGNVEVEFVIREGKSQAAWGTVEIGDSWDPCKLLD